MLILFLEGVLEVIDGVNHGKRQAEDSGIHKSHATGSSANGWRPRVVKINSSSLFTVLLAHIWRMNWYRSFPFDLILQDRRELIEYLFHSSDTFFWFKLGIQVDLLILGVLM